MQRGIDLCAVLGPGAERVSKGQYQPLLRCCLQVDCSAGRAYHDRLTACVKSTAEENAGEEVLLLAVDALSQALQGLPQHSAPEQQSSSTPQQHSSVNGKTPFIFPRLLLCYHAHACSLVWVRRVVMSLQMEAAHLLESCMGHHITSTTKAEASVK